MLQLCATAERSLQDLVKLHTQQLDGAEQFEQLEFTRRLAKTAVAVADVSVGRDDKLVGDAPDVACLRATHAVPLRTRNAGADKFFNPAAKLAELRRVSILNAPQAPFADVIAGTVGKSGTLRDVVFLQAKHRTAREPSTTPNWSPVTPEQVEAERNKCGLTLVHGRHRPVKPRGKGEVGQARKLLAQFAGGKPKGKTDGNFMFVMVRAAASDEEMRKWEEDMKKGDKEKELKDVVLAKVDRSPGRPPRYVVANGVDECERELFYPLFVPVLQESGAMAQTKRVEEPVGKKSDAKV